MKSCPPLGPITRPHGGGSWNEDNHSPGSAGENTIAVVYNACRRQPQRSQTQAKKEGMGGAVAPWLLFIGGIVQRGVKMSSRRNEFSLWYKTPQVTPVSGEMLHNTHYKREKKKKNCIFNYSGFWRKSLGDILVLIKRRKFWCESPAAVPG